MDKEVFLDRDFVRQNPMLVNDTDKFEFSEANTIMRKRSVGQWLILAGNLVICINLILNAFELLSLMAFRIITAIAIIIDMVALIMIWKKSEF